MFTAERYEVRHRPLRLAETWDIYAGTGDDADHILRAKQATLHRRDTFRFEDPETGDTIFRVAADPTFGYRPNYTITDERTDKSIGALKHHSSDLWRQTWELFDGPADATTDPVAIAGEASIWRAIARHHITRLTPIGFNIYPATTEPRDALDATPLVTITGTPSLPDSYVIDLSESDTSPSLDPRLAVLGTVVIDGFSTQ